MTDKELRRLSRAELVDIIFELQKRCEECYGTIDKLPKELHKLSLPRQTSSARRCSHLRSKKRQILSSR